MQSIDNSYLSSFYENETDFITEKKPHPDSYFYDKANLVRRHVFLSPLRWSYGADAEQTRANFAIHYAGNEHTEGKRARKWKAIPLAIVGLLKVVYHLVLTVLSIPVACYDSKYAKANLFNMGRDFQEVYGRLKTICDDEEGSYHVQESQFHKDCYQYWISPKKPGEKINHLEVIEGVSYGEFCKMDEARKSYVSTLYNLKNPLRQLEAKIKRNTVDQWIGYAGLSKCCSLYDIRCHDPKIDRFLGLKVVKLKFSKPKE